MHHNVYTATAGNPTDVANAGLMSQALSLSSQASQAEARGDIPRSIELNNHAAALKVQVFGEESVEAALSFNEGGESYLKTGKLIEAERALLKALKVRDDRKYQGKEKGPRCLFCAVQCVCARGLCSKVICRST